MSHAGDCLEHSKVLDSRYRGGYVHRRRVCTRCNRGFFTSEFAHNSDFDPVIRIRKAAEKLDDIIVGLGQILSPNQER